ncbi:MAG: hypothetical protein KJ749_02990, partial [Planctomycetes bacterium]|nr:hypothetical protein [Planctomycetota bacterium]
PFASSFRVPGRGAMGMPVFLMLMLVWLFRNNAADRREAMTWLVCVTAALQVLGFVITWRLPRTPYAPVSIRHIPAAAEVAVLIGHLAGLALLCAGTRSPRFRPRAWGFLGAVTCATAAVFLYYGTWTAETPRMQTFDEISADKQASLDFRGPVGMLNENAAVQEQRMRHILEPFLAKAYTRVLAVPDIESAYEVLATTRRPDEAVIVGWEKPKAQAPGADLSSAAGTCRVVLSWAGFNRLVFDVDMAAPGFLCLRYPGARQWRGYVDAQRTRVYEANGRMAAIPVESGRHTAEFRYWSPGAMAGIVTTCITLALFGCWLAWQALPGKYRAGGVVLWGVLVVLLCGVWLRSLYGGRSFGTRYAWDSTQINRANLAYGRLTRGMSLIDLNSAVVDQDCRLGTGVHTYARKNPTWVVDLGGVYPVRRIDTFEGRCEGQINTRPLLIGFSVDDKSWEVAAEVRAPPGSDRPLRTEFNPPIPMRYVFLRASGNCELSLDEVEVYSEPATLPSASPPVPL